LRDEALDEASSSPLIDVHKAATSGMNVHGCSRSYHQRSLSVKLTG
jgi:hypothetical protein